MNQSTQTIANLDIRGVIFDMDGLLLNTEALYIKAWVPVGERMGIPITAEVAQSTVGHCARATEEIFQRHYGDAFTLERSIPVIRQWITDYVAAYGLEVKPGVRELTELLRSLSIPMAIGSSNIQRNVEMYLEEAKLSSYFDTIVTADLVERAKPAPDIFLKAAENLGLAPAQCLVFEDSPIGVEAAHAAGCNVIVVPDLMPPCELTRSRVLQVMGSLEEAQSLFIKGTTQ